LRAAASPPAAPAEHRPAGLQPDGGHRPEQDDAAALSGADVREKGWKVTGDEPEDRLRKAMLCAERPVEKQQPSKQGDRVDDSPHLDANASWQKGDRDRKDRDRRRA